MQDHILSMLMSTWTTPFSIFSGSQPSSLNTFRLSKGTNNLPAILRPFPDQDPPLSPSSDTYISSTLLQSVVMAPALINENPVVYGRTERRVRVERFDVDEYASEPIDEIEVFDHLRDIKDPEHPYTLEELKVISEDAIEVDDKQSYVRVMFTPTVEHCSFTASIGLCLRVKLMRCLPSRFKVDIRVAPGAHATENEINKQLNDKERVAAALENPRIVDLLEECLNHTHI